MKLFFKGSFVDPNYLSRDQFEKKIIEVTKPKIKNVSDSTWGDVPFQRLVTRGTKTNQHQQDREGKYPSRGKCQYWVCVSNHPRGRYTAFFLFLLLVTHLPLRSLARINVCSDILEWAVNCDKYKLVILIEFLNAFSAGLHLVFSSFRTWSHAPFLGQIFWKKSQSLYLQHKKLPGSQSSTWTCVCLQGGMVFCPRLAHGPLNKFWSTGPRTPESVPAYMVQSRLSWLEIFFVAQNRNPHKWAQDKCGACKRHRKDHEEQGLQTLLSPLPFLFSSHVVSASFCFLILPITRNVCFSSNEMQPKDTQSFSSSTCYSLELLFVSLGSEGIWLVPELVLWDLYSNQLS